MIILLFFSFLAGIATVLSPCTIPILPALLSGSARKGRLQPIGIVLGVIGSFIFIILAFRVLIQFTDISPSTLEYLAIVVICLFGLAMIFPSLGDLFARFAQPISNVGSKIQMQESAKASGLFSGILLGIALGLLWTPCAGPILATVITLAATNQVTAAVVLMALCYGIGAAIPMFLIIYGGQRVLASSQFFAKHAETVRKFFGVLMLVSAFILATHLDTYFTQLAVRYFPFVLIDDNALVNNQLQKLKTGGSTTSPMATHPLHPMSAQDLPLIEPAPEFTGIANWINSKPLTIDELHGKVVLVDFWTYSCINCIRTLPYVTGWYEKYKDKGFIVIGVHTPEFEFEKNTQNVIDAAKRFGINYPIAQDNNFKTWQAYHNQYWPAKYLIDQHGVVRLIHFGEGEYLETENAIRLLLNEPPIEGTEDSKIGLPLTPETYLGYARAESYADDITFHPNESFDYTFKRPLKSNQVGLAGKWIIGPESITADGNNSILELNFIAKKVFLVIGGKGDKPISVMLDGVPIPKDAYTADMDEHGDILVNGDRKYDIVDLKEYGRHTVTLTIPQGISVYAFTFGD